MARIIKFPNRKDTRQRKKRMSTKITITDERCKKLRSKSPSDAAQYILKKMKVDYSKEATPILKIINSFNIKAYSQDLAKDNSDLEGFILVTPSIQDQCSTNKAISVDVNLSIAQRRFVMAHELGHYIFDCGPDRETYVDTYVKNHHDSESEKKANAFAAELLMPKSEFEKAFYEAGKKEVKLFDYLCQKFEVSQKAVIKRISEVF